MASWTITMDARTASRQIWYTIDEGTSQGDRAEHPLVWSSMTRLIALHVFADRYKIDYATVFDMYRITITDNETRLKTVREYSLQHALENQTMVYT